MGEQRFGFLILLVLLILSIGYIALDKYQDVKQREQLRIFQQGMQAGYEQAVIQLVEQAVTCQQVPVRVENQTINMIAVQCLEKDWS